MVSEAPATPPSPRSLKVGGFVPFSTTDFPKKLSAVVFVQGCPWQCVYCHNPHLQSRAACGEMTWETVRQTLQRRQGLLDAVVFSGGEPTLDPALADAMQEVREMGFAVALHTGGAYPARLAEVLPLVDWVGLDIKAPFTEYDSITAVKNSGESALASLQCLLASKTDFECRTTVHPDLLSEAALLALAKQLAALGVKNYALQLFREQGCLNTSLLPAPDAFTDKTLMQALEKLFARFILRKA